jgi:hypothetical protein
MRVVLKLWKSNKVIIIKSGGELLKIWLLDNQLGNTFGRKSTARLKIYQLLKSSKSWLNWIRADDKNIVNCSDPVLNCCWTFFLINYFTETAWIQSARHFLQLKLSNILNSSRFMIYIDPSETTRHFFARHNLKFLISTGKIQAVSVSVHTCTPNLT